MIVTSEGTVLNEFEIEYRKKLIEDSKSIWCPIIKTELLSAMNGEIVFVGGLDYFVSEKGMLKLKDIFGEKFIQERIITYD